MWIYIGVILCLGVLLLYKSTKKPNRFPPGPPRLPFIGSIPYIIIRSKPSESPSLMTGMLKAFSKYGNIVGFYVGSQPNVAVSDFNLIKELMKHDETASRPSIAPFQDFRPGGDIPGILDKENADSVPGIIFSRGKAWTDQRRFVLRVLRDFGFGKTSMEDTLLDEVEKLCDELKKSAGQATDISLRMNISILNALWALLTGEKLQLNDPKLQNIIESINAFLAKSSDPTMILPSLLPIPIVQMIRLPFFRKLREAVGVDFDPLLSALNGVRKLTEEQVERHKTNLDEDNINDFIDAYLVEIKNNENNPQSSFYKDRGHYYLINVLIDLFFAGMETTSSALTWSYLLLLHHPEIKRKLQKEIDTVIGKNRSPSFSDKDQMHYTNAFMMEAFRITSFVHHSIPHYATSDITLGEYVVPKGAVIFPSLISVMYDSNHFPDPHTFKPERFLDADGRYKEDNHVIPFCVGKRYCLGQSLALKEFFLFLVGTLQKFEITPAAMQTLPSYHIDDHAPPNLARTCPNYQIIFTLRT